MGTSSLNGVTGTITSVKALCEAVKRYKGRDTTLARLEGGLQDLTAILDTLKEATDEDAGVLAPLKGPVSRCALLCHDFEEAMKTFSGKSKTTFKDWTKMEFMRGDINEFIEALAQYKATIAISLGAVTL
jgi:hypothetical protein